MVLASANRTSVRRRSKYLEAFLTTSSCTRYIIRSLQGVFEVVAEFENRGACPEPKLRIDRRHPVLENVKSRRMSPLSPKSSSGSSAPSIRMVFTGSGSGMGAPGCALSFWVNLPDGFGEHAAAGVFWLRVKLLTSGALLFGGVLLEGVLFEVPFVAAGFSVDTWAVLGVRLDLVFMAVLCY